LTLKGGSLYYLHKFILFTDSIQLLIKTHVVQFHHNDDGLTSLTFKNGDVLYLKDLMNCCAGKDKW